MRRRRTELSDLRCDVAIVGGGPVGLGLAIELGQRGVECVVVEKSAELHHIPKGQNLTQRTMEHFRCWGVEDRMRAARVMPPGYPAVGINAYGNLMSEYAHPWFRRSDVSDFYFAANERLPQYETERVLRERVSELATVRPLFGIEVDGVGQDEAGCIVRTAAQKISAHYVVGCDGSRSRVRRLAGISETRRDHDRRMVLLVFRSKELQEVLHDRFGPAAFFNVLDPELDGYWRFLGTVDTAETWFFHAPVAPDATASALDYTALLTESVGTDFAVELDYIGFWDLRIAFADDYRNGRIFVAGDAAHSHPPYGGYGINTGFEDARNLGWKLAANLEGWGGERLLDSYSEERRAVFASTARDFIEAFIQDDRSFIAANDPATDATGFAAAWEARAAGSTRSVNEFVPHYEGSPLVWGSEGAASGAVGTHSHEARPGHHLPPPRRGSGELFAALGAGFSLLVGADEATAPAAELAAAAHQRGVPMSVIESEFAADYGSSLVLVRPDHYVTWTDTAAPADAGAVVARAAGY